MLITRGTKMRGFWHEKFEELATFNSDPDKSKYTKEYLEKMRKLQLEFDIGSITWAKVMGWKII